jgi:hypothetical protein
MAGELWHRLLELPLAVHIIALLAIGFAAFKAKAIKAGIKATLSAGENWFWKKMREKILPAPMSAEYGKIVALEKEAIELTRANRLLEEATQKLRLQLELAAGLKFVEPFWYAEGDSVPYCPGCWEGNKAAIHLTYEGHMAGGYRYDCPNCKTIYCSPRTPAPRAPR